MQKHPDTPTHVRGTRLQPLVSGAFARLQPEPRDCTILHTILHVQGELPQVKCKSLKTVQVSRLGANEQNEQIQPAWLAQSQNSKKHQVNVEIDTGP